MILTVKRRVAGSSSYRLSANPDDTATETLVVEFPQAAAAPTSGAHVLGEVVLNSNPSAGGFAGWVCTAAGTPGTWLGFGTIETPE